MVGNGDVGKETCPALSYPDDCNTLFHDRIERVDIVSVRLLVSRPSTLKLVDLSDPFLV
jgi:hypothetical protein